MVLQDTWLFDGTIRENGGRLPRGSARRTIRNIAAAQAAYVDHFMKTLPEGYDTRLGDDRQYPGQRQLLTIARAFY